MTSKTKSNVVFNINKIITFVLSIIFLISFITFNGINLIVGITLLIIIALNIANYFVSEKVYICNEILIYEIIAFMGIFQVNYLYALVFILVTEKLRYFKNKTILFGSILLNSILYLLLYYLIGGTIYTFWYVILILLITVLLSVYLIYTELTGVSVSNLEDERNEIEEKYFELLQEHKNVLILKDIMDISNKVPDIQEMTTNLNDLLLKSFENIDYSTILIFNQNRAEFNVSATNVNSAYHKVLCKIDQFDLFEDVINNTYGKVISSQISLKYPSAGERRICSVFCLPLHTNKSLLGLLLLESTDSQAFKNMDINQFNIVRYNMSLIIENKLWIKKIEKMALLDGLTGVYNRNYLFQFLEEQFKWHQENNKSMCMVLFDIDHFKKFNDTYGHLFGDLVLKELSNLVKKSIREIDLIARYGGEEFIIVFTDADKYIAKNRTEDIRRKIENMIVKDENNTEARVTVSFGIAEYSQMNYNISIKDLIERSDQALYKSKENGRNQVTVYE